MAAIKGNMKPGQGFQKGNKLHTKATAAKKERKENLWNFLANGGRDQYHDKLEVLASGKKLSEPEKEYMDRVEKLYPYVKSKAPTEITGKDGKDLIPQPIIDIAEAKD